MGSVLRATLILGSGSAVSLIAGFLSNKAYAVWVGPEGVGLLGLFQSLLGIAAIVAGMGLSAGLVRLGAAHVSASQAVGFAALRQAAWQLYAVLMLVAGVALLALSQPVAALLLAGSPPVSVLPLVAGLALSLAAGLQIGLLNAHHRVGLLARVTAFSSITGALWGIGLVYLWRESALPWVILGTPVGQLALSSVFVSQLRLPPAHVDPSEIRVAREQLIRFGLPYVGSQLIGSAVQLGMPFLVLHQLGQEQVGYYRAAVLFSTAYIGFLLNALGQDFYPRLSALQSQPKAFLEALNTQQRFVLLLGSPLVAASIALAPLAVSLLFSPEFAPTVGILQWQLVGDLFRFVSWTLGYAVLAGLPSKFYLFTETLGGISLLSFGVWGMYMFGVSGLGIGWMLSYLVYLLVVGATLVLHLQWQPTLSNLGLLLLAVGVAVLAMELPQPLKLGLVVVWGLVCVLLLLWQSDKPRTRRA